MQLHSGDSTVHSWSRHDGSNLQVSGRQVRLFAFSVSPSEPISRLFIEVDLNN
jgi:hypothetical protein